MRSRTCAPLPAGTGPRAAERTSGRFPAAGRQSAERPEESVPGLGSIGRALGSRNYRLFFGGQSVSLLGTWLSRVAVSWLVYRLTGSAYYLGMVGFAGQVPAFLLGPLAGVLVDRWDRHRLLCVTQALSMVQSFLLAALTLPGVITVGEIVALSAFQGLINALDTPARQAFVVEMVESREDLPNAIALNSSMFNAARLVGPALAGLIIAAAGEGTCFLADGFSYLAVIGSLLAMKLPSRSGAPAPAKPILRRLKEGFRYAFGFPPIRSLLLLLALVSFAGTPYVVLLPVFTADVLHGGPYALGFLYAASGLGALAGALYLAARTSVLGLGSLVPLAAALFGGSLIGFAFSHLYWLSLILLTLSGFGMMVQMASSNTLLQTMVDDDQRGRVMSFYTMAFLGMAPFGSLAAGLLANAIGGPVTLAIGGTACLLGAMVFARKLPELRVMVRPIYVRKGILPEVAAALQSATGLTELPEK
jgi:MFS family permease